MHHRPGKSMGKPDALSQWVDHRSGSKDNNNMVLLTPEFFAVHALEELEVIGEEQDILKDNRKGMESGEKEEAVAKVAKELQKSTAHSVCSAEWTLRDRFLYFCGKVYVPNPSDLRCHIVSLCHDSKIAGHSERWKTLELVSRNYWRSQMSQYVGKYVSTCDMCLQTKSLHQPPSSKLHPLLIPDTPWDTISVDFIVKLPWSNGWDAVMVVVDSVSKCTHLSWWLPLLTTSRVMDKQNRLIRNCSNTFKSSPINARTIGLNYFPWTTSLHQIPIQ